MENPNWFRCLDRLQSDLSEQVFDTWIRPLQAVERNERLVLLAPNHIVMKWVKENYSGLIEKVYSNLNPGQVANFHFEVGNAEDLLPNSGHDPEEAPSGNSNDLYGHQRNKLDPDCTFASYVEGKFNRIARAASIQVSKNPGSAYNPLFIYGGVGLGKTHLLHAIGHAIVGRCPSARIAYVHSERFVSEMVRALQKNTIDHFKKYYRNLSVLLVDDIQFFAGKERSQEEFFHTFNALMEDRQQIVLTCDRYPKEVEGLEERLKSRFGCGLSATIEPPELETRVAIVKSKASLMGFDLPEEIAFFLARSFRSNVRELEGALHRVIAYVRFSGDPLDINLARNALHDLLIMQERSISIEGIQKITAKYFKIRVADLLSKRRNRSITRPRQIAMALCKELTSHSLPEIGDLFGGRDHTTVLHACRRVTELRSMEQKIDEDYANIARLLAN
ncbi:MAG: chromosomal replication initiator protein DnaA [Candidatus Eutrophobiaceae bacterium]